VTHPQNTHTSGKGTSRIQNPNWTNNPKR